MPRLRKEYRSYNHEDVSYRAFEQDGKRYLEGYASVFNQKSKLIYENNRFFYEVIDPTAFRDVLADEKLDVILTFNHSREKVMARTTSNTLKLSTDERGLKFVAEIPNVSYANDTWELVNRQDLFENSFAFVVRKGDEQWTKDDQGNDVRLVKRIAKLLDVSVVVNGAYANTVVSARNEIELERGKKIIITIEDTEDVEDPEEVEIPIDSSVGPMDEVEEAACGDKKKEDENVEEKSLNVEEIDNKINEEERLLKDELEKLRMHLQVLKLKR